MSKFQLVFAAAILLAACRGLVEYSACGQPDKKAGSEKKADVIALLKFPPAKLLAMAKFLEKQDWKGGTAFFNGLGKAEQRDPRIRMLYAQLLLENSQHTEELHRGAALLRELATVYPCAAARAIYAAGMSFESRGERGLALAYFQEAVEADPFFAEPYLAISLFTPDKKDARAACQQAMALSQPGSALHLRCQQRLEELDRGLKEGN